FKQEPYTLITDSKVAADATFTTAISNLLNLGAPSPADSVNLNTTVNPFFEKSNIEDDTIIVPPLYGSFYRDNPIKTNAVNPAKTSAVKNKDWYNQLNLNPAFRVAAGRGTAVIQKDQETFMDR